MLELNHLQCGQGRFTLSIDAHLEGFTTGLFGSSGAGKSTLLELIAGLRRPQSGAIRLGGIPLVDVEAGLFLPPEERHLGYVPQDGALFPHLSVEQNLRYGEPRALRSGARTEDSFSLAAICDLLDLSRFLSHPVTRLSGGERQRVCLGRALLSHPRALLLDEPLASLDWSRRQSVLAYLTKIQTSFRVPIFYVSHEPSELIELCDEVLVLVDGKLADRGAPREVFTAETARLWRWRSHLAS